MNDFETALVSPGKNSLIPEEDNWFGPLVGTWDIEWVDGHGTEHERHVKGEWIFSGSWKAWPSRMCSSPFPGGPEDQNLAGRRLRHDDQNLQSPATDMGHFLRCGRRSHAAGSEKGRQPDCPDGNYRAKMKWIFSELTENTFHWRNMATEDGTHWFLQGEAFAARRT